MIERSRYWILRVGSERWCTAETQLVDVISVWHYADDPSDGLEAREVTERSTTNTSERHGQ